MESDRIKIRSEEVQDILGYIPPKFIRWGVTVILVVVFLIIGGSLFFRFPDVMTAPVTIVSLNPAVEIKSKIAGKIEYIFVRDSQYVKKDCLLAVIENSANPEHVKIVRNLLIKNKPFIETYEFKDFSDFCYGYELGSNQSLFSSFVKNVEGFRDFDRLMVLPQKNRALKIKSENIKKSKRSIERAILLEKGRLEIVVKQFKRDSLLFCKSLISDRDFDLSKEILLQTKLQVENSQSKLIHVDLELADCDELVFENKIEQIRMSHIWKSNIRHSYEALRNSINSWELKYVIKSPRSGYVSFNNVWSVNQNVDENDVVFSIVPKKKSAIVGLVNLPISGSGKVKVGQMVNIKLDSYPSVEYGMLNGEVSKISMVPTDGTYLVEVAMPLGMRTNYKRDIQFKHHITGRASIITEDNSMFMRVFNPLKHLFKNRV